MSSWRYTFIFLAASTSGSFILSSFLDSLLVVFLSQPPLLNLFIRFAHISSPLVFFLKIPAFNLHSERYQLSYHLHLFHVSSVLNLCSTLFSYIFHNLSFFWNFLPRWMTDIPMCSYLFSPLNALFPSRGWVFPPWHQFVGCLDDTLGQVIYSDSSTGILPNIN